MSCYAWCSCFVVSKFSVPSSFFRRKFVWLKQVSSLRHKRWNRYLPLPSCFASPWASQSDAKYVPAIPAWMTAKPRKKNTTAGAALIAVLKWRSTLKLVASTPKCTQNPVPLNLCVKIATNSLTTAKRSMGRLASWTAAIQMAAIVVQRQWPASSWYCHAPSWPCIVSEGKKITELSKLAVKIVRFVTAFRCFVTC